MPGSSVVHSGFSPNILGLIRSHWYDYLIAVEKTLHSRTKFVWQTVLKIYWPQ